MLFIPTLVMSDVAGLEVVKPVAGVAVGGLITCALCALFIVPALYVRFAPSGVNSGDDDPEVLMVGSPDDRVRSSAEKGESNDRP